MFALIPFYEQPRFQFLGGEVQAWDIFVGVAFVLGVLIAARSARKSGLNPQVILDYGPWALVWGFSGAHLVHCVFYEPHLVAEDPWFLLKIWSGLSSFGGFLGASVALMVFFGRRKESFWDYADSLGMGLVPAWFIARVGCFVAHDHKGSLSDFALAVDFPGGARHDLGLYEAMFTLVIWGVISFLWKKNPRRLVIGAVICSLYAVGRFPMDALRATDIARSDARYLGLTPAQYGCIALFCIGLYMWKRSATMPKGRPESQPEG